MRPLYSPRVSALRCADNLEELAAKVPTSEERELHLTTARIIRYLAQFAPDYPPNLKIIRENENA
jgi:hypothetical protein